MQWPSGMNRVHLARRASEPLLVAAIATVFAAMGWYGAGHYLAGGTPGLLRSMEIALTWTAAGRIAYRGYRSERAAAELKRAVRVMADSLSSLDEIRYALDQA